MAAHAEVPSIHTLRALYSDLLGCSLMPDAPYTGEPISPLLPPIVTPRPASLMPIYVAIVLGGMLIGGGLAIAISLVRPPPVDNATLISTVLTGVGVAVLQALNFIKSNQAVVVATQTTAQVEVLHKSVNSGFEEFARLIRAEAREAGKQEAESKLRDVAAAESRIEAAVAKGIAEFQQRQPTLPPTATATVNVAPEAVTVEEMKPQAAQAIADAVRPDISDAITDAMPPERKD